LAPIVERSKNASVGAPVSAPTLTWHVGVTAKSTSASTSLHAGVHGMMATVPVHVDAPATLNVYLVPALNV
jgi:hypothetical protein